MKPPAFLVIADRGRLLAYAVDRTVRTPIPRLLEAVDFEEAHQRLGDQVSDKAGAFPVTAGGIHANAIAERMTLVAELETRGLRRVADRIATLLRRHRPESWAFAAPGEINGAILDALHAAYHSRLAQNLPRDLTRVPAGELLGHFSRALE